MFRILNLHRSFIRQNFKRFVHSETEIQYARTWLETLQVSSVPQQQFVVTFSRSSGPGGQKVNKTSSKATIQLDDYYNNSYWIPEPVKQQLRDNNFRYVSKNGNLTIQSDSSRSRDDNLRECFKKLVEEIKSVVHFAKETSEEDKEKWDTIKKKTNELRLKSKQHTSEKKKLRKVKIASNY